MKIDEIEPGMSTFEVPGSKWNLLLRTRFLPGASFFLPAGDVGGEIKATVLRKLLPYIGVYRFRFAQD